MNKLRDDAHTPCCLPLFCAVTMLDAWRRYSVILAQLPSSLCRPLLVRLCLGSFFGTPLSVAALCTEHSGAWRYASSVTACPDGQKCLQLCSCDSLLRRFVTHTPRPSRAYMLFVQKKTCVALDTQDQRFANVARRCTLLKTALIGCLYAKPSSNCILRTHPGTPLQSWASPRSRTTCTRAKSGLQSRL